MLKKKFTPGKDWVWYAPNTFDCYGNKEIMAVNKTLKNGWLTVGKITAEFENEIAKLFGKKYGLFVNSGSSANLLALAAAGLPRGEIITPACTFNTTVSPILQLGFTPVFVDVEEGTYVLSLKEIEKAFSKKTVAVLIPHLVGNFFDIGPIRKFTKKRGLFLIEDSCDTIGGLYHGKPSGLWSDITTTSFYASHIITAAGAGGMLMTNDRNLRERARVIRDWGRGITRHDEAIRSRLREYEVDGEPYDSAFVFSHLGYNMRPTEIQAAFGLSQLKRLKTFVSRRRRNFNRLVKFFRKYDNFFILPKELKNCKTNWLAFPLTIRAGAPFRRNDLVCYLEDRKIQTRPLFSGNIVKQPAYADKKLYKSVGKLKNSQTVLHNSFLIGAHHGMTDIMVDYICDVFEDFLSRHQ